MNNNIVKAHLSNVVFILTSTFFLCMPVVAQEENNAKHHPKMHHKAEGKMQHKGGHMKHGGGHHGAHGMIAKGSEKFPTSAYNETKKVRSIERPSLPSMKGDPVKGKTLAYTSSKGRCLACHIMGADGDQAGNIGPNLSTYGKLGRDNTYTFQKIWDARSHNAKTIMPPFGTNEILTKHEVVHIAAYINSLKHGINAPKRAQLQQRNYNVAGEDFTLADIYIEEGETIFKKQGKNGESCASCHSGTNNKAPNLKGVAATYPKYDSGLKNIIGLEQRINICQKKYKHSDSYRLGSVNSNLITSYVKFLSRRIPINISTDGPAAEALERGKATFFKKSGQLNFSCADCHATAADKWLRGQSLSSIQPDGKHSYTASTWPKHFIAGHDLGLISLRQRIRHCQVVTRTYPLKLHAQEYTDLELYLTTLA
ncbi:MAG: sulfur oxidation c-type cytochrome SoxA, partial [Woeseiaceae bacterium]